MSNENTILETLPLHRGAVLVIGGELGDKLAQRIAHQVRRARPRLKVIVATPEKFPSDRALNIFIPCINPKINSWLRKQDVDGVCRAIGTDAFEYTDATTGKQTTVSLPLPKGVTEIMKTFGEGTHNECQRRGT